MHHPLDAIPIRSPDAEARSGSEGILHLRRPIPYRGRLDAWFRRILRMDSHIHLQLDRNGSVFWSLVDGRSSLRKIAISLAETLHLALPSAQDSAVVFTKMLMTRRFLAIQIPSEPQ